MPPIEQSKTQTETVYKMWVLDYFMSSCATLQPFQMEETFKNYLCLSTGFEYNSYLEKYNYETYFFAENYVNKFLS